MAKRTDAGQAEPPEEGWREGGEAVHVRLAATGPESEEVYWLLVASVPMGLFETSMDGALIHVNPAAVLVLTGTFPAPEEPSSLIDFLESEQDWETLRDELGRLGEVCGREILLERPDGGHIWAEISVRAVRPPEGSTRVFGSIEDISVRKHREERLRRTAGNDPLTGLPHRASLMEKLKREVARMRRDLSHRFAVGFVDLDDFKSINDNHGHMVGDQVLLAVAHRLKRGLRPEDTVFRYGGDEFAVVLEGVTDAAAARTVGTRMLEVLRSPFQVKETVVSVSASIGIRLCSSPDLDPQELLFSADRAMYSAKSRGGGDSVEVVSG